MKTIIKNSTKLLVVIALFVFNSLVLVTPAYAATASFTNSGGGTVSTNQNVSVTVTAKASEAFNAVSLNVNFANLTYISSTVAGGWTTVSGPTRSGNTVSYSGALLGTSSTNKAVITLVFRTASSAGTGTVSSSGSVALANGSGTQVNASGNTVTYTTVAPTPTTAPTPTALPVPGAVSVSSSTHPDSSLAYKATTAVLNWVKDSTVTDFSYIVDQQAATIPDETTEGSDITKTVSNLVEGTNYFHIKAKNSSGWGGVTHFVLKIDFSNPNPFALTAVKDASNYIIYFATDDLGSGVKKYTVNVDGTDFGQKNTGISIPLTSKEVIVTAEDNAGNKIQSEKLSLSESSVPNTTATVTTTPAATVSNGQDLLRTILILISAILLVYSIVLSVLYFRGIKLSNLFGKKAPAVSQSLNTPKQVVMPTQNIETPTDIGFGKSPLK